MNSTTVSFGVLLTFRYLYNSKRLVLKKFMKQSFNTSDDLQYLAITLLAYSIVTCIMLLTETKSYMVF